MSYAEELRFIEGETTTREIAENAAVGTNVGDPLTFSNNTCRRFRLRGTNTGLFKLTRVYRGVQLKTKSTFDYETMNTYEVRITASSAGNTDTITVTINVTNVNEAQTFSEAMDGGVVDPIHRSVLENTAAGTNIGNPIAAVVLETLNREALQAQQQELQTKSDGSLTYQRAIALLESVLASMRPTKRHCWQTIQIRSILRRGYRIAWQRLLTYRLLFMTRTALSSDIWN